MPVVPLHFFGSRSTISRFVERFRDGQYSLVSFLFAVLLLNVPSCAIPASEMTYIVSSGALNSTHSLTPVPFVNSRRAPLSGETVGYKRFTLFISIKTAKKF